MVGSAGHPPGARGVLVCLGRELDTLGGVGSAGHPPGARGVLVCLGRELDTLGGVGSAGHPPGARGVVVRLGRGHDTPGVVRDGGRPIEACHGVIYTFTASCLCISSTAWASLASGSLCVMRPSTLTRPWLRRSKASRSSTGDDEYVVEMVSSR